MSNPYCRLCGNAVRKIPGTYRWQHVDPGADHAPIPSEVS